MNQVQAVLLTYWQRATVRWMPVAWALLIAFVVIQICTIAKQIPESFIWMSFYLTAPIAIHMKQQSVHIREGILPGAMRVHLAVGLVLILLCGVLLPMYRMFVESHWCWGYPGLCVAIAGATFAGVVTQARWLLPFFFMAPIAGNLAPVRSWIVALWQGQLESSGVLMVMMGIGCFAFAIHWLLTATEEDRGYYLRLNARGFDFYKRDAVETAQTKAFQEYWRGRGWFTTQEPSVRAMHHWRAWGHGTLWQQLQLWEFGRGLGMLLRGAIVYPLMLLLIPRLMGVPARPNEFLVNPMLLLPGYLALQMRMQQKAVWPAEILRPVSREKFYLLAGLGIGLATFTIWAVMFLVMTVGVLILDPGGLSSEVVLQFVLLSGIGQLWIFSIGVWCMRYRNQVVMFLAFLLPMMAYPVFSAVRLRQGTISNEGLAVVAAISVVLCAGIVWDAYRRWLRVEIG